MTNSVGAGRFISSTLLGNVAGWRGGLPAAGRVPWSAVHSCANSHVSAERAALEIAWAGPANGFTMWPAGREL
jgi:hypothetical protein